MLGRSPLGIATLLVWVLASNSFGSAQTQAATYQEAARLLAGGDVRQAVAIFQQLAAGGDAAAATVLGEAYRAGAGVPASDEQAVEWFRVATERGHPRATANLADALRLGRGIERDFGAAAQLYASAAAGGYAPANTELGRLYLAGLGVPRDERAAARYFGVAAAAGDKMAGRELARLSGSELPATGATATPGTASARAPATPDTGTPYVPSYLVGARTPIPPDLLRGDRSTPQGTAQGVRERCLATSCPAEGGGLDCAQFCGCLGSGMAEGFSPVELAALDSSTAAPALLARFKETGRACYVSALEMDHAAARVTADARCEARCAQAGGADCASICGCVAREKTQNLTDAEFKETVIAGKVEGFELDPRLVGFLDDSTQWCRSAPTRMAQAGGGALAAAAPAPAEAGQQPPPANQQPDAPAQPGQGQAAPPPIQIPPPPLAAPQMPPIPPAPPMQGAVPPPGQFPGQLPGQMPGQFPGQMPGQMQGQFPGQMPGQFPGQAPGQFPGQAPGQFPGQMPGPFPGQVPGQMPGQFPGQMPGQFPGQMPGQFPGQVPGQMQGQFPGQMPGQFPGQVPGQMQGQFPGQMPGQFPGQVPGQMPGQMPMPGQPGVPGFPAAPGMAQPGMPGIQPAQPANPILVPGPTFGQQDQNQAPPPTAQTQQLTTLLVGEWEGSGNQQGMPTSVMQRIRLSVMPDGRFQQVTVEFSGQTVFFWGRFFVAATGPSSGLITVNPEGWQPQQVCYAPNICYPVNLTQTVVQFAFQDQQTLLTSAGGFNSRLQRVR